MTRAEHLLETMDPALGAVHQTLQAHFGPHLAPHLDARRVPIEEMPGGASTRRFFRVHPPGGRSLVAVYVPEPSQEIQKAARQTVGIHSFVEVRDLLDTHGVSVPALFHGSHETSVLLVEDLGDDTLAQYLLHSPDDKERLYRSAVRDLARAQRRLERLPERSIVRGRSFDADLLRWEVDHFREWALEARGVELSPEAHAIFERARDHLADTIAGWPRGFVHRDYQSRNLMVRRNGEGLELVWIDFQDAMLGPRVYDLVALLTDSYQTFSRSFVEARLAEYAEELGTPEELPRLVHEFDFVTVQRKLKDAGRFVFIDRVNDNPHFLGFVEPTIEKARRALSRVATTRPLAELEELLGRVLD